MDVAALLLTGGRSRRMGWDKAALVVDGVPLAARTGRLVRTVATGPAVEVGPGSSGLEHVPDETPGAGPLAAIATGTAALRWRGWTGAALVVATDLPRLNAALLRWLAGHSAPGTVVPVAGGHPQWLCARYSAAALDRAAGLVAAGYQAPRHLGEIAPRLLAAEDAWSSATSPDALADVDAPEDLARFGIRRPDTRG